MLWQVLEVKQIVPKSSNLLKSSDLLQSDRVDVYDLFRSSCDKLPELSSLLWLFSVSEPLCAERINQA